ncbi:hypothetical protein [Methylotenera sp.]|uniref:hypothetical protein n=1 Tax=Methylotenera sp. TaxID=2051956 RepID=UPI00272FA806|nr:hypothetical protein [Methylotenera sp.]MDP2229759.1 hypothetical protein [Methylotenera sp.]MDP3141401.1 hypothetical protein [Methylotenera sp.]
MQIATQQSSNLKAIKTTKVSISKVKPLALAKPVATELANESSLQRLLASCCDCV